MNKIANTWLEFSIDIDNFSFSIASHQFHQAGLTQASFSLTPDVKTQLKAVNIDENVPSAHGPLKVITATYLSQHQNIRWVVEFALPDQYPFLLQRMSVENLGTEVFRPERFVFASIEPGSLQFSDKVTSNTAFYSNGWQSWSPSGTWRYGQRQVRSRLKGFSYPMLYDHGTPITRKRSSFSSDMFAAVLDSAIQAGLIGGFLSQKEQFGSLECKLHPEPELKVWANCDRVHLNPGKQLQSDWFAWQFIDTTASQPFEAYFAAVSRENQVKERIQTPVGWCSWYYYFQNITPAEIQKNLTTLTELKDELPIDYFQIDDGFEQDVGSWFKFHPDFPEGIAPFSDKIRQAGFTPGIWLAPFIVESRSELKRDHSEWLLRSQFGRTVNSGFVWNWFGSALDLTHPEVQDFVRQVITTAVNDWNYPYLKLDFLYAAALPGFHFDPTLTRAQILRKALELIRQAAGEETLLLGCGCPIGSGIGIFDIMRISADVSPGWEPEIYGLKSPFKNEPNMPSARNAIQNILSRAGMDPHFWVNDPDCILVREDSNLSLAEVQSLATAISITGGAILISDDMTTLGPERLRIAANLLPPLPPNPIVKDLFTSNMPSQLEHTLKNPEGEWKLIALFNWEDQPADLTLNLNDWGLRGQPQLMREFWSGEIAIIEDQHIFRKVPPHGVRLIALRQPSPVSYLGSDLHLSQGTELKSWAVDNSKLEFTLDLGRVIEGNCYLWLPSSPSQVLQDGIPVDYQAIDDNIFKIPVNIQPDCRIQVIF